MKPDGWSPLRNMSWWPPEVMEASAWEEKTFQGTPTASWRPISLIHMQMDGCSTECPTSPWIALADQSLKAVSQMVWFIGALEPRLSVLIYFSLLSPVFGWPRKVMEASAWELKTDESPEGLHRLRIHWRTSTSTKTIYELPSPPRLDVSTQVWMLEFMYLFMSH